MILLNPEDATPEKVHARLCEITARLIENGYGEDDWGEDPAIHMVAGQFENVLAELESEIGGVSWNKTFLMFDVVINGKYGQFRIDYATGKVHEWGPQPLWDPTPIEEEPPP